MNKSIISTVAGFAAGIALIVGAGCALPPTAPEVPAQPVATEPCTVGTLSAEGVCVQDGEWGDVTLIPCPTEGEDLSLDCYWDAAVRGNGGGTSFIQFGGEVYYPES